MSSVRRPILLSPAGVMFIMSLLQIGHFPKGYWLLIMVIILFDGRLCAAQVLLVGIPQKSKRNRKVCKYENVKKSVLDHHMLVVSSESLWVNIIWRVKIIKIFKTISTKEATPGVLWKIRFYAGFLMIFKAH
jgi:hypothetical protein